MEKWKSKTRIPTFPPPLTACGSMEKIILRSNPGASSEGQAYERDLGLRFAAPGGQGVIVVDREK